MKMKLNKETKAKFVISQTWGQYIDLSKDNHTTCVLVNEKYIGVVIELLNDGYALVRTALSQITDEDAIEVAKMATHLTPKKHWKVTSIKDGRVYFTDSWQVGEYAYSKFFVKVNSFPVQGVFQEKENIIVNQLHYQFPLHAYDYLRSKSYVLPFQGIYVEEQIKLGWVKLREE